MIEREIILNYYNYGESYYGSYSGMRYAIERVGEKPDFQLQITIWSEPFCFEMTPKEEMKSQRFDFTEDGYDQGILWLNEEFKRDYSKE